MPENRLDSVRKTLEHELELADAECQRLKAEQAAAEADRKGIADAIKALGGKKPKPGKPAPKKDQVLGMIASFLDANGPMPKDDLKGMVEVKLTEHGNSLNGFVLRFGEALKDPRIEINSQGEVCLAHSAVATK